MSTDESVTMCKFLSIAFYSQAAARPKVTSTGPTLTTYLAFLRPDSFLRGETLQRICFDAFYRSVHALYPNGDRSMTNLLVANYPVVLLGPRF